MEQSSGVFFKNGGCGACHAQNITDVAVMRAKAAGVRIDQAAATQRASGAAAQFSSTAPRLLDPAEVHLQRKRDLRDLDLVPRTGYLVPDSRDRESSCVAVHRCRAKQLCLAELNQ
jgi:hypothetical protein